MQNDDRERLPFAIILAFFVLGHDIFNAANEFFRLFSGASSGNTLLVIDLVLTVLIAPSISWGLWRRSKWSRWGFVGYKVVAVLTVSVVVIFEIVTSGGDRVSMLVGYIIAVSPSVVFAVYFGNSRTAAIYLGYEGR